MLRNIGLNVSRLLGFSGVKSFVLESLLARNTVQKTLCLSMIVVACSSTANGLEVQFEIKARLEKKDSIIVFGKTNLPEGKMIDLEVFPGTLNYYPYQWAGRTPVGQNGEFEVKLTRKESRTLPRKSGFYTVKATVKVYQREHWHFHIAGFGQALGGLSRGGSGGSSNKYPTVAQSQKQASQIQPILSSLAGLNALNLTGPLVETYFGSSGGSNKEIESVKVVKEETVSLVTQPLEKIYKSERRVYRKLDRELKNMQGALQWAMNNGLFDYRNPTKDYTLARDFSLTWYRTSNAMRQAIWKLKSADATVHFEQVFSDLNTLYRNAFSFDTRPDKQKMLDAFAEHRKELDAFMTKFE